MSPPQCLKRSLPAKARSSRCRAGLAPVRTRHLCTAHAMSGSLRRFRLTRQETARVEQSNTASREHIYCCDALEILHPQQRCNTGVIMSKSILTAVLAAVLGSSSFAAPNLALRSFSGQRSTVVPPVLSMQTICIRGTCCHWGNNGDFWACAPR